eukprot:TRINITY_DN5883_c0_g1_i1.p1 TRINITY_DN5883_c0_g1~~TRINITY_DN5883_c0_g1_i1.p1  ORF type:complete len:278 (+),score=40.01 TRINITY_DN5883_c0_g1_i1:442-1275(+)
MMLMKTINHSHLAHKAGYLVFFSSHKQQHLSFGSFAILLQLCQFLLVSALLQSDIMWLDGSAFYYLLSEEHQAKTLGLYILRYPQLLSMLTEGWNYLQALTPIIILSPISPDPIKTLTSLFLAISYIFLGMLTDIGLLRWIGVVGSFLMLPAWFWETFVPNVLLPISEIEDISRDILHRALTIRSLQWLTRFYSRRHDPKKAEESTKHIKEIEKPSSTSFFQIVVAVIILVFAVFVIFWNMGLVRHQQIHSNMVWLGYAARLDQPGISQKKKIPRVT